MKRFFSPDSARRGCTLPDFSRPCGGFTLLELLAVMALIGLMAGTAVPRMFLAVDAISAGAEERELTEIMGQIKLYAFLRHAPQRLAFQGRSIYRDETPRTAVADFKHLVFSNQQITWNVNGFSNSQALAYTLRGQEKQLLLE